jgi:CheY-like chemotaxis protein
MNHALEPVLIVEDSDEDFEVTVSALRLANVKNPVLRCCNGREVSLLLNHQRPFENASIPRLILLDLNLAGTDGRKLIAQFRQAEWLATVPISILTTSSSPEVVASCYAASANAYLVKPVDLLRFEKMIADFITFWFDTATLPGDTRRKHHAAFSD